MADLRDYHVGSDWYGTQSLEHLAAGCYRDVPGDDWTIAGLIHRAEAHEAEAHRDVVDGDVVGAD